MAAFLGDFQHDKGNLLKQNTKTCPTYSTGNLAILQLNHCILDLVTGVSVPTRMAEEGIADVVSPFMKQLTKAKDLALHFKDDAAFCEINPLFQAIEKNVRVVEDVLLRATRWEKGVINDFGILARNVEDILEENCNLQTINLQLQTIDKEITSLKDRMTLPLNLPRIEPVMPTSLSNPPSSVVLQPSDEWRKLEIEKKILVSSSMSNLQVSYENLDLQLKLCLLCFSIFPENSIINKRTLIYWWIGEGLLTPTRSQTAEETGETCFNRLIANGLIEPIYQKRRPTTNYYRMHPWTRRMVIFVAKRGQFFDFDAEGNPTSDFSATRRACLALTREGASQEMLMKGRNNPADLLTLFNINEQYLKFEKSWFSGMRKINVLHLGRWQNSAKHHIEVESTQFLEGLQMFKHLRILDLRACHNLERLTEKITSFKKLTHLDVSGCYLLEGMPKGIGSLLELQVLKGFVLGDSTSKKACRLTELAKLEKLRKLSISIGSQVTVTEGELNELGNCGALRSLTITWAMLPSKKVISRLTRMASMTITSLSLPPSLEKLDVRCFPSKMVPNWLVPAKLGRLKKLYIRGGMLTSLGKHGGLHSQIWNVEVLRLKFLCDLEVGWPEIQAIFPHLTYLEVHNCEKLTSLPCDKDGVWMNTERERSQVPAAGATT
ncbi:disease resistance RPP13-like protein 4 [Typha angustifolia]|uniref:disease resistance RPP13-like protein 4 n=1 Tax=Typha angustifolia TaxID=59011 RepID=UPI003C2C18CF